MPNPKPFPSCLSAQARALALALLVALPARVRPQAALAGMDALPTDPVLAELIADSLAARPELLQAQATASADRERVPQAGALPDPVLSLGIQNDGFRRIQVGRMETSFYQVMVSQGLPWPGKRALREDVSRLAAGQAENGISRLRLGTEAEVRRAYLGLQVVRERLGLLGDLERIWQRSLGAARARYESGDSPQSDVLRGQLELNRLLQRRLALRAEEEASVQALNRLRGRPLDESVETRGSVRDLSLPLLPDLDAAVADAETRSPELADARRSEDQAEVQLRLARRDRFPDLAVQAGLMLRGGLDPMWTAGVSIGLPIWSGRKQERAVAESQARAGAATDGALAVAQVLRLRVAERRAALASLLETIRIFRQGLLIQSQATTESTLAQYRVGRVTFASVLEAAQGFLSDEEAHLLATADAQRLVIAFAEASLDPVPGVGAPGGMGGTSVPGTGATGGGMAGGAPSASAPGAATDSGSSSSSGM